MNMRVMYHFIAEGTVCNNSRYRELGQPNELEDISTFVENRNLQPDTELITVEQNNGRKKR